ncbi:allophanate hydrolase subunit 1 [Gordonia sp. ABSL1-1]|uniref:5-oxoprolinase subunit B family protein n=1 Tax=Gordonia sp. ABSL1-1 TaxID=3053923 RepID=UPI00257462DD|nr:allophanate hydrolase subunit 1 [Gordonia sp. ABSL1-1]MDL9938021.1 allophanate hydrolase subunit 1 [Gordonia sp. ABSL1-1]
MRVLPAGADAVVLDFSDVPDAADAVLGACAAVQAAITSGLLTGVTDLIPSAHTLLVQAETGRGIDILGVRRALRTRQDAESPTTRTTAAVTIPVVYDGADLDAVATQLQMTVDEVIAAHRDTRWTVQFMGFAPGFGYLVPTGAAPNPLTGVARRTDPRTQVPCGSVAIAAGYSAIYPRDSPGGWQLLGHTTIGLWDENAQPPALLAPGTIVTFTDEGRRR